MQDLNWQNVVLPILETILGLIGAWVAATLLPKLPELTRNFVEWSKAHVQVTKNTYANGILARLVDLVGAKVLMLENTLIEDLKEAAKDGKITKEELLAALAKVKDQAIADVKTHASALGIFEIAKSLFLGDEKKLDSWLSDVVEATVAKLPPSGLQTAKAPGVEPIAAKLPVTAASIIAEVKKDAALIKDAPPVP